MAPSVLLSRAGLGLSWCWPERLRGAIVQTIVNDRPRLELRPAIDGLDTLRWRGSHAGGGTRSGDGRARAAGYRVVRWPGAERNLFGGVFRGRRRRRDARGGGRPRRGGAGLVVARTVHRQGTRPMRANSSTWQAVGSEPEGWLIADGNWRSVRRERRHLRLAARSRHVAVLVAESDDAILGRLTIARDAHPASLMSRMSASWSPGARGGAVSDVRSWMQPRSGPRRHHQGPAHAFPQRRGRTLGYHRRATAGGTRRRRRDSGGRGGHGQVDRVSLESIIKQ